MKEVIASLSTKVDLGKSGFVTQPAEKGPKGGGLKVSTEGNKGPANNKLNKTGPIF